MLDSLSLFLSEQISNNIFLAPLFSIVAGIITSFSPCCLSSIPLVIGYVETSGEKNTKRAFLLSLTFSLGMAITFTSLGVAASLFGRLLKGFGSWSYIFLGVLMLLMALQIFEIYNFIPSSYSLSKNKKRGFLGAFLTGILGGFFSSPCATPVLIVLLSIVAGKGSLIYGVFLLLLYAIGHSVLVMIAGTSVGFVKKLTQNKGYGIVNSVIKITLGSLVALLGFYMLYLGF